MTQNKSIDFFRPDWTDSSPVRSSQASLKKKPLSNARNVVKNTTSSPVNPVKPVILERKVPRGAMTAELKPRRGPAIVTHYPPKVPISSQIPLTSPATTPRRSASPKPSSEPANKPILKPISKPALKSDTKSSPKEKEVPFVSHPSYSRTPISRIAKPERPSKFSRISKTASIPTKSKKSSSDHSPFLASVKVDKVPLSAGPASSSDYAAELSTEATIEPPKKSEKPKNSEKSEKPEKSESKTSLKSVLKPETKPKKSDIFEKLDSEKGEDPRRSRPHDPIRPVIKKPKIHIPTPIIIAIAILLGILTGIGVFALIS